MDSFLSITPQGEKIGQSLIVNANCFDWLKELPENSLHAVITDPPYGVKEYQLEQLKKKKQGKGGTWRIPRHLTAKRDRPSRDLLP
jgi:site-specific DNA-methyltransferase (adenine-specific)